VKGRFSNLGRLDKLLLIVLGWEVGSHEGRIGIASRGVVYSDMRVSIYCKIYTKDGPICIWRIRSRNIASTLATASSLASAFCKSSSFSTSHSCHKCHISWLCNVIMIKTVKTLSCRRTDLRNMGGASLNQLSDIFTRLAVSPDIPHFF